MSAEFNFFYSKIMSAVTPEDLFGVTADIHEIDHTFKTFVFIVHPDKVSGDLNKLANNSFIRLNELYEKAKNKIKVGTYGKINTFRIKTKKKEYEIVLEPESKSDIYNVHRCLDDKYMFVKIVKNKRDNDLALNEYSALKKLSSDTSFENYLPELIEKVTINNLQSIIVRYLCPLYSLSKVMNKNINKLDGRTVTWIMNRLLEVTGFLHQHGIINCNIIPPNILIDPKNHGVVLSDFTNSTFESGKKVASYLTSDYSEFYPQEITRKEKPKPQTDIYMIGYTIGRIYNGDNRRITNFINSMMIENPNRRPNNAWKLRDDFEKLLKDIYGNPKFHDFNYNL